MHAYLFIWWNSGLLSNLRYVCHKQVANTFKMLVDFCGRGRVYFPLGNYRKLKEKVFIIFVIFKKAIAYASVLGSLIFCFDSSWCGYQYHCIIMTDDHLWNKQKTGSQDAPLLEDLLSLEPVATLQTWQQLNWW